VTLSGRSCRESVDAMEFQSIEPEFLSALAERATEEERRMRNPYLKALMGRLNRLALELKAALEKEGGSDGSRAQSEAAGKVTK
jgi:hypothetical protein